ncbi:endonuclease/exonuclease/phosphatase family protein [Brachybacterium fresconis]|uniref:Endonuclease/exonuclease/phosphatase family metal-dependent hydrolase n=1 Tax=Brachybacterium fresconis TaxID=173363 RepID=A0ABS4YNQ0_9MICO|nr:endonuclease/exonuclease/phosphatase family protein [Brachybacterium fresconis]MBP2410416.1 endonuclease/exonuclease/phosphatase family metal-dependent hydrolase [Brachybacterium fresconis]
MPSIFSRRRALAVAAAAGLGLPAAAHAEPNPAYRGGPFENLRVATFNVSLNRPEEGELLRDLESGQDEQVRAVAEVIQINNPDVILLNEFDHDEDGAGIELFRRNYLEVGQNGRTPVYYPYAFSAPVNTGVPSELDLDGDGTVGGPGDAWGFGEFPGQYGMVVFSRHPILTEQVRTFQKLRWADMPSNLLPTEFYSAEAAAALRLSSKSHWDVPVQIGTATLHVLAAHPTPPSFDGPEKRNQRRNSDEIRLWADYLSPGRRSQWIVDDAGTRGGLAPSEPFVVLGDYNSDPVDGDSWPGAIDQLLHHPRIRDTKPTSAGAVEAAELQGGANAEHTGEARYDTADFADDAPGNLRVDYVLPAKELQVASSAVYWPEQGTPGGELTGEDPFPTSDHRLVRADLQITP